MPDDILYIDDNLDTGRPLLEKAGLGFVGWDINEEPLLDSAQIIEKLVGKSLVLMAYDFHETDTCIDGIEFLEKIRAALRKFGHALGSTAPALGLIIYTDRFDKLTEAYGHPKHPAFFTSSAHIDWAIEKDVANPDSENKARQLCSLTNAYKNIRRDWSDDHLEFTQQIREALALNSMDDVWELAAFRQFRELRPPLQSLIERNDASGLIRWLLNVALPFPSCFLDNDDLAVVLGFNPVSLEEYLAGGESAFSRELSLYRYAGPLGDFFGERYWKAGIEDWMWSLRGGPETQEESIVSALKKMTGGKIATLETDDSVLTTDPDTFLKSRETISIRDAVQIQPDYWPAVLEAPWLHRDELRQNQRLRSLVINLDLDVIEDQ